MKQEETVGGAAQLPSSPWRSLWQPENRLPPFLVLVGFVVFCLPLSLPCDEKVHLVSCPDVFGFTDLCTGSGSFCFPSTLMGFLAKEDSRSDSLIQIGKDAAFKMSNGGIISCSIVESMSGIHERSDFGNRSVDLERVDSCKGTLVPNACLTVDEHSDEEIDTCFLNCSSSPMIDISPPLLDWGTKSLYSPSLTFLSVVNKYNDSILYVYEPFSTNMQFYVYNFDKFSLAPGESASIGFVFLPRWLGLSSAHIVLQTNLGGFIIHAKGISIESPYQVVPLVGFDISSDERLSRKLSLHNPFDDVLYVEEVRTWVSVSSRNVSSSSDGVCSIEAFHQSSNELGSFLNDEWFSVMNGVDIRPHKKWEVPPHNAETVVELNLWPHLEGKVVGAICMKLRNSMQDRTDTVIVPLEVEVHDMPTYSDLTGSVSVYFEPLVPFNGRGSTFSLSLRNDASILLNVVNISEVTESLKLFEVKYTEGLILFPGTLTQIALINYTPQNTPPEIPSVSSNCSIFVSTNATASQQIKIPCQDLIHTCCTYQPGSDFVGSEGSYIGLISQQEKESSANSRTGSLGSIIGEPVSMKPKLLEVLEPDELILRNWRSHATTSEMSVLKDQELLFPVVQIGTHLSKWITVHNPSPKPVIMQLVLNSGAIIDQCKPDNNSSELYTFSSRFPNIDSIEIKFGFSLPSLAVTEAFVHPFGIALFGPITFRPSNRCLWRSSALIRNNLSGVEWLPLRAFGGSHSLVLLDGSEPVSKVEFNLDLPIILNESSLDLLSHSETILASSCGHLLSKELVAKNTGELPLEVTKLDVSGNNCGLDGFVVENCEGFSLPPGESMRLQISYQSDFSSALVHRDLELAMASGMFVIPMRASLSVYMISLCRKSVFSWAVHWKLYLLVFAAVSILFLVVFRVIPHAFPLGNENYFVKGGNTTIGKEGKPSRLHHNTRNSRSFMEDEKSEAGFVGKYSNSPNRIQDSSKRLQERQYLNHQKATLSPRHSTTKPVGYLNSSDIPETTQNVNLTVRIAKERGGRRRKRKTSTGGLASKFEVSSSQSGNSTPSSPLSPSALETSNHPFSSLSERNHEKNKEIIEVPTEARDPEAEKPSVSGKLTGRTLLPCATFPGPNWRTPGVTDPNFLVSTSPIAPHARAPGSKLGKDKGIQKEENDVGGKELTYDIWGNHFSSNILGRQQELKTKLFDASEGDSQSFFARDPQSLMMLSSARSVSPDHKLPFSDVNFRLEMD